MSRGLLLGPLILLPLLGALFLVPQPDGDHSDRFTMARASLLQCHVQAGDLFAFTPDDSAALPAPEGPVPGTQDIR